MTVSPESIPRCTAAEALAVAERDYGIVGSASTLPSERDQNFLIVDSAGGKFVLKIANSAEGEDLLDFQNQAMRCVAAASIGCRLPRVVTTRSGQDVSRIHNSRAGVEHCLRVLTWIDGEVLGKVGVRGPELFESIGAGMARIDAALSQFRHPAMRRVLQWDLRQAVLAREHLHLLSPDRQRRVERAFARWERIDWTALRHSVIHGDANDHNLIIESGRMVGILDFGDIVYSATVCDLAVALAYVLLDERQPLAAAARVIGAYQRTYPLNSAEQEVLMPLVESRLAMSVCYSVHNRARHPDDPYQSVTEAAAWDLLDKFERWSADETRAMMNKACGALDV